MTSLAKRNQLVNYINGVSEKKMNAIYAVLETEILLSQDSNLTTYNEDLEKAEREFEEKKYITHGAMQKRIKQWKKAKTV
jgi:hypothetical protein